MSRRATQENPKRWSAGRRLPRRTRRAVRGAISRSGRSIMLTTRRKARPTLGSVSAARCTRSRYRLTIRTFAVAGGRIHLWVGGGIVWDSDPDAEIEESWVKARPLLDAIGAPLGEVVPA